MARTVSCADDAQAARELAAKQTAAVAAKVKADKASLDKALQNKADLAAHHFETVRIPTVSAVREALRNKNAASQVHVLVGQMRHRINGCSFVYSFKIDFYSNLKSTERSKALFRVLEKMIAEETTKSFVFPESAVVTATIDVPSLGTETTLRRTHDDRRAAEAQSYVQTNDNEQLTSLDHEFIGYFFLDGTQVRYIENIEWNGDVKPPRFQAVAWKIKKTDGKAYSRCPFGLRRYATACGR